LERGARSRVQLVYMTSILQLGSTQLLSQLGTTRSPGKFDLRRMVLRSVSLGVQRVLRISFPVKSLYLGALSFHTLARFPRASCLHILTCVSESFIPTFPNGRFACHSERLRLSSWHLTH